MFKNMTHMLQKAREDYKNVQKELETYEVTGSAGGVQVVMTGRGVLKSVSLSHELVQEGDRSTLEELIVTACNQARESIDEHLKGQMGQILPPGAQLPF